MEIPNSLIELIISAGSGIVGGAGIFWWLLKKNIEAKLAIAIEAEKSRFQKDIIAFESYHSKKTEVLRNLFTYLGKSIGTIHSMMDRSYEHFKPHTTVTELLEIIRRESGDAWDNIKSEFPLGLDGKKHYSELDPGTQRAINTIYKFGSIENTLARFGNERLLNAIYIPKHIEGKFKDLHGKLETLKNKIGTETITNTAIIGDMKSVMRNLIDLNTELKDIIRDEIEGKNIKLK